MKFFDAHTHAQFAAFDADRDEVIARSRAAGVGMVNVGTNHATSEAAIKLAEANPDICWATIGLHPIHTHEGGHHDVHESAAAHDVESFDAEKFRALASYPKVVAIGECGLDYYRIKNNELGIKEKQKTAFVEQIKLAHEVGKPLMIHCRNAFPDLMGILIHNSSFLIPARPGIVHFFSGTLDDAKKLLEMGFYFTFGGVITFVRDYDETIKTIPLNRMLSETDAPYVAPTPHRGKRNEPFYVIEVVKKLAELKKLTVEETANRILKNVSECFNLKLSL